MSAPAKTPAFSQLDPAQDLADALMQHVSKNQGPVEQWPLSRLVAYLLLVHHEYLRRADPLLRELASDAAMNHGKRLQWLPTVEMMTNALLDGLANHLNQEEELAFPGILQLEASGLKSSGVQPGLLRMYIQSMQQQLQFTLDLLHSLRELTNGYAMQADCPQVVRLLFQQLMATEKDLSSHIYLEKDILFPRALTILNQSIV